jgi:hypothetical protein
MDVVEKKFIKNLDKFFLEKNGKKWKIKKNHLIFKKSFFFVAFRAIFVEVARYLSGSEAFPSNFHPGFCLHPLGWFGAKVQLLDWGQRAVVPPAEHGGNQA